MLRLFSSLSCTLTIIGIILLITCTLPTDPALDPNKVKGSILLVEPANGIIEWEKAVFGIAINYPVHIDSITVSFGDTEIRDTTIYCATSSTTPETLIVHCVYTNEGLKTVKAKIALTNQSYKDLEETFRVSLKKATVSFEPTEPSRLVPMNESVILYFQAVTVPAGHVIDFTVASVPPLSANHLGIVDEGSRAKVTVTCPDAIQYKIICYATTGTDASDTTETTLIPYSKPIYSNVSGNTTSTIGTADTLLFVLPKDSSVNQITLLDSSSYAPGIIKILPFTSDTVILIFTPDQSKTYAFSFLVTKDNLTDTVTFQRVVSESQEPIWKQHSSTVATSEGKLISHSFGPYLADTTLANSSFAASKGTISGKTLNYAASWGSTKDSIIISANRNGTVSSYTLILSITSGDSSKPVISPEKTSDTTNAAKVTCKFSVTDAGAGVGKVSFRVTNATVLSQTNTDSMYQCVIDSLKHGILAILTVVASDSSIRTNSDSLTITILRDTTLADNDGPIITHVSGPKSGERVTSDTATIRISVEDGSGVSGVTATLNSTTITGLTKDGSFYSIPLRLTAYGANRILISATDKAATTNSETMSIDLDYNTKPSAITPVTPPNDSTGVALLPAFTWSGGIDTDKDTVFYRVFYGTAATLNSQSAAVTTKNVTLTTPLTANTKYYWQVIGYTTKYRDTVRSAMVNFTTLNDDNSGPVITFKSGTADGSRVKEASGSIIVSVTDLNGIDSLSATLGGIVITGITSSGSDYTIPYTLTQFGLNSIVIRATDNSSGHNTNSITINCTYNTSPSALTMVSPSDEAQEINTLPTFKWEGGADADGDSVYFRVLYGTNQNSPNTQSAEYANVSSIKLTGKLLTNTVYYWKVIGYTKGAYKDTITLGTYSFRTTNPDRITPIITIISPASYTTGMRVTTATGTITFRVTDANGIDSVYYVVNATGVKTMVTGANGTYSFSYTLPRWDLDTITISAVDSSAEHNKSTAQVIVNYNSPLATSINVSEPSLNATEIALRPTISWAAPADPDGDLVSYRVAYGREVDLSDKTLTNEVTITTLTLPVSSTLISNTKYYYRIIGYTKTFPDTASSPILSFTTVNQKPEISLISPVSGGFGLDPLTAILTFSASDPESGSLTYTIAVNTNKENIFAVSNVLKQDVVTTSCPLSALGNLTKATKYYWRVIAKDNGTIPKSDTSAIDSFYTRNSAPVWTPIADGTNSLYYFKIDLSMYCRDSENHYINYNVITGNAKISNTILTMESDSQLITITAKDTFSVQPGVSQLSFRRGYKNPLDPVQMLIPAKNKSFKMGTDSTFIIGTSYCIPPQCLPPKSEQTLWSEGKPTHFVSFSHDFYMDQTEVTGKDYKALMNINPSIGPFSNNPDTLPVYNVTWFDAVLYCNARSKRNGFDTIYSYTAIIGTPGAGCSDLVNLKIDTSLNGFRLPSEAEWEFACRSGTTTAAYWPDGDDPSEYTVIVYSVNGSMIYNNILQVKSKKPNAYNLYDMIGNVAEWCNDWYKIYTNADQRDPVVLEKPNASSIRVARGGYAEWQTSDAYTGSTITLHPTCGFRYNYNTPCGFRCVRTKRN